jgi:hypothetical protein
MTTHYVKDTKKFWRERETARVAFDKKRANAPFDQKIRESEQLRSDASFLKKGKIVLK